MKKAFDHTDAGYRRLIQVCFVASLLVQTLLCNAQSGLRFTNYTKKEYGLPDAQANEAFQDGLGFIWINHNISLSRFDGHQFKSYRHIPGDTLMQLGPQFLGKVMIDENGELWLNNNYQGMGNGLLLFYDRKLDGFVRYKPDVKGFIHCMSAEKSKPVIWLGSNGEGLFEFDLKRRETTNFKNLDVATETVKTNNFITSIQNGDKNLLLFTANGLWNFDKTSKTFNRPKVLSADSTMLLTGWLRKAPNSDWVYAPKIPGMLKLDASLKVVSQFSFPEEVKTATGHGNGAMDKNDVYWFIGNDGLYYYDTRTGKLGSSKQEFGWSNQEFVDRDQNIWLCGWELGLRKVVTPDLPISISKYPMKDTGLGGPMYLRNGTKERVFMGSGSQKFKRDLWAASFLSDSVVLTPHKFKGQYDQEGNLIKWHQGEKFLWIATWNGGVMGIPYDSLTLELSSSGVRYFEHEPGNPYSIQSNQAWSVWEANPNELWVGSRLGLSKIDLTRRYGAEGSVMQFNHDPADSTSLSDDFVRDIEIVDGKVFLATQSGVDLFEMGKFKHILKGVYAEEFSAKNDQFVVFTHQGNYDIIKDGESYLTQGSQIPFGFYDRDLNGNFWMATQEGFKFYNPKNGVSVDLTSELESSQGMAFLHDGKVIGTLSQTTLMTFDISKLKISGNQPTPALIGLRINNKQVTMRNKDEGAYSLLADVTVLDKLELDYLHNNFSVEFAAMEMTAPERNRYRHRLDGFDPDWIESDARDRTATYTNLPPGTYTFRIRASNHHGVWGNNERTLGVVILPPPWRTWWAYSGYFILGAGLLVWARRNIVQRERLKASLLVEQVEREKEHFELEKAKEIDRVKTSFFTNISHEFRTPLTLIKGPVQGMIEQFMNGQNHVDKEKVVSQLKLVQRNSDLLLKLINQLLDLAKLESGTLKVEKSEGDLYSYVRATASSFESFARQKNITLEVPVSTHVFPALFDKDKVETILINLINNAIKFTPSGGSVTVSVQTSGALPVTLSVKDTGIGIPKEHQSRIFERFHQVNESHKEVGTGIGLSLVKELVTLMGGEISVKSAAGAGSEFTVVLPIELLSVSKTTEALFTGDQLSVIGSDLSTGNGQPTTKDRFGEQQLTTDHRPLTTDDTKPQVLVVEDNADLRAFIIDSLGTEFHFHQAENGKQGLEIATREIPDMIISDVMMPEMDGMEMTRRIKEDIKTSHIPLILLTAKSGEDSKLEGLSKGADDYLTKPFNKQELLLKVRNGTARMQKLRDKLKVDVLSIAPAIEVQSEDEQFLQKVKETIVERMSDEQLSVESLADDMGMSRVQLYRKVSALTGMAVNELIRKLRLQRAAQLLGQEWGPVSQVAYEVGFSNLSYFSKVFKEEFGVLPSEYEKA